MTTETINNSMLRIDEDCIDDSSTGITKGKIPNSVEGISNEDLDKLLGITAPYENSLEHSFLIYQHSRTDIKEISILSPDSLPANMGKMRRMLDCTDYVIHRNAQTTSMSKPINHEIVRVCSRNDWKDGWRETSDDYKAMRRYCKKQGYKFSMYDESRIYHKAFRNMQYILAHLMIPYDPYSKIILDKVQVMGVTTVDYLLTQAFGNSSQRQYGSRAILHLLATNRLGFDAWSDLDDKMEVWYV